MRTLTLTALFVLLILVVAGNAVAALTSPWWLSPVWIVGGFWFGVSWCELVECAVRRTVSK